MNQQDRQCAQKQNTIIETHLHENSIDYI